MIYCVFGTTGEYSDREQWPVKALRTELAAQEFCLKAKDLCRKFDECNSLNDGRNKFNHPMDPNFQCTYTGTSYDYYTMELEE